MRTLTILSCSLLLSAACKNAEEPASTGAKAEAKTQVPATVTAEPASTGPLKKDGLFQENAVSDPCALLTAPMVADVAQKEVRQRKLEGMCLYSWTGGNAAISSIKTYKSAAEAKTQFDNGHTYMSADEVKEVLAAVGKVANKKVAAGGKTAEATPAPESAEAVAGTVAKSKTGVIRFEAVDGVGDAAAYDRTRHEVVMGETLIVTYPNKLDVLLGNLSFAVSFALNAADHNGLMYKDEAIVVAKAVLKTLAETP